MFYLAPYFYLNLTKPMAVYMQIFPVDLNCNMPSGGKIFVKNGVGEVGA